ncbi:AbrB/MazE/SpoVT family DNA-binding domain-containing protein [Candidatus Peregrinibacteria bacterium]|nr:MAG: AbrB/MazE/SpoVT family DNA-binding domain-containing protein [Candidatus Peregrinibacteria bacterium]
MDHEKTFYGSTVIGERGQMVVPSDARKSLRLKKGEKLLVFGVHEDTLIITKVGSLEKYMQHLTQKVESLKTIINQPS